MFDLQTLQNSMAKEYTPPSQLEQVRFHHQLESLSDSGVVTVDIAEVETSQRVPWEADRRFVDVSIKAGTAAEIPGFPDILSGHERTGSSATHTELVPGVCHAASEALERFLVSAGGDLTKRPTPNSVFSVFKGRWTHLPFHPLMRSSGGQSNPHFSRSGEAFHINKGEAMRSAYCEVLEREALCRFISGAAKAVDATAFSINLQPELQAVADYWRAQGYDFRVAIIPSQWGVCVAIAACLKKDLGFPVTFKGSGADFTPRHAIRQAVSELGRNAFMGPAARYRTQAEVERYVSDPSVHWSEADNLKLTLPQNAGVLSPIFNAVPSTAESTFSANYTPISSLETLEDAGLELWAIPVADDFLGIDGAAYKFIVPGFPQLHRFVPDGGS